MKINLPYIQTYRDRHGKRRWYYRRDKGTRRIALPSPASPEFVDAYCRATVEHLSQPPAVPQPSRPNLDRSVIGIRHRKGGIYFIQDEQTSRIKIGFSKSPMKRAKALATGASSPLRILGVIPGSEAEEKELHQTFASIRVKGEWFKPASELRDFITKEVGQRPKFADPSNSWNDIYSNPWDGD